MKMKSMMFLAAAGLILAVGLQAQETETQHDHGSIQDHGAMKSMSGMEDTMDPAAMKERCQAMMDKRDEMTAHMAAMDEKLEALVAEMNAADGAAKADSVAAVVNELVSQKKARHQMMMKMQQGGMKHMMHRMGGQMGEMKGCPMMEKMSAEGRDADVPAADGDSSDEDHSAHH